MRGRHRNPGDEDLRRLEREARADEAARMRFQRELQRRGVYSLSLIEGAVQDFLRLVNGKLRTRILSDGVVRQLVRFVLDGAAFAWAHGGTPERAPWPQRFVSGKVPVVMVVRDGDTVTIGFTQSAAPNVSPGRAWKNELKPWKTAGQEAVLIDEGLFDPVVQAQFGSSEEQRRLRAELRRVAFVGRALPPTLVRWARKPDALDRIRTSVEDARSFATGERQIDRSELLWARMAEHLDRVRSWCRSMILRVENPLYREGLHRGDVAVKAAYDARDAAALRSELLFARELLAEAQTYGRDGWAVPVERLDAALQMTEELLAGPSP